MVSFAEKCRRAILKEDKKIGKEYIDEAQHQDGVMYWRCNFNTPQEAVEDFNRYKEAKD